MNKIVESEGVYLVRSLVESLYSTIIFLQTSHKRHPIVLPDRAVCGVPDSKVHGANIGPIWGRQDPGGPHVGPMNLAIRDVLCASIICFIPCTVIETLYVIYRIMIYLVIMRFDCIWYYSGGLHVARHGSIHLLQILYLIARFMGPTWGPSGADRTQVGPMLAPWTLLSRMMQFWSDTLVVGV